MRSTDALKYWSSVPTFFRIWCKKNKFNLCEPVFWRPPLSFIDILSSGAGYTIHSNMSARPALLVDAFPISDSRLCTKLAGENSFWVLCLKFTETRQRPAWPGMGLCGFGSGTFWENINLGRKHHPHNYPC